LRAASLRARRLGFGAKLCIHPRQVAVVEAAFAPAAEEIAWARRIVEAAQGALLSRSTAAWWTARCCSGRSGC